jgi:hypothetical protein
VQLAAESEDRVSEQPGRKYLPANGSEGEGFMSAFCDRCIHDQWDGEQGKQCEILNSTFTADYPDGGPEEWRYVEGKGSYCTEFAAEAQHVTVDDARVRCSCAHLAAWHEGSTQVCRWPGCECRRMVAA